MTAQPNMRQALIAALEANDRGAIETLAVANRTVLSVLVRLAYDKTSLRGWRAIKAIGIVSSLYVNSNYEFLRDTVRKLLWSLSDESGGIGWSAPEILGEIVCADPKKFSDIVPLIAELYNIEEKVFRPGILYALGRVAGINPELVAPFKDLAARGLEDQDPLVRFYALVLAAELRHVLPRTAVGELVGIIIKLTADNADVWVFENDGFINEVVSDKAKNTSILYDKIKDR